MTALSPAPDHDAHGVAAPAGDGLDQRRLPPVIPMAIATLALVVTGGIFMAAHIPRPVSLVPPVILLATAGVLLLVNVVNLARLRDFAWPTFFLVGKWALLAYLVVAGMLEYVFVLDHTPGAELLVLTLMLATFAVDVPLLLAFSVARFQPAAPT